ncbi:hypothetical protein OUZ56_020455 [Daphnia magna]|uniref:Uncharacterized protein n=1 Tax=Daphnia magna TaxID=35525 RepID=A0ABQ9ZEI8_9CRUS|nr:hypothetical protein OUZ56_020455 [Daphnia magna]
MAFDVLRIVTQKTNYQNWEKHSLFYDLTGYQLAASANESIEMGYDIVKMMSFLVSGGRSGLSTATGSKTKHLWKPDTPLDGLYCTRLRYFISAVVNK